MNSPSDNATPRGDEGGNRTVHLSVPEMDCPSCGQKVTGSVRKLDGIEDVDPQFATGTLVVTFDPTRTTEDAIAHRVESVGYDVPRPPRAVTARFTVPEMDCPSCAKKVGSGLRRLDGVTDIDLQPTTGTATVSYDPDRLSEETVVEAIEGAGYDVTNRSRTPSAEPAGDVAEASDIWTSPRAIKTWVGAVFLVFGLLFEFLLTAQNVVFGSVLGAELALADALLLGAIVSSGAPVLRDGYYSARNRSLDIDLLMATAIVAATGIGYFEEAATLAVLFSVAELLEDYAMDRARHSLRELVELSPDEATVRRDGEERTISVDDVRIGDVVVVRPGEKVPMDGAVVDGESAVDESPITGESVPVDKAGGDDVYAGTINTEGYLEVEVTSEASENTLSRIIEMVQGAQQQKTESEQFVDRFAGYYTPAVVVAAILTAAVPPLAFQAAWQTWFVRGLTFLVIACPCAFVISTPVSVVSGITSAAKNGVLIKGGNHLEAMGEVDAIALDKTGTLTKGELAVTDVVPAGGYSDADVLRYAARLERRSEHPIARAIVRHADESGVSASEVSDFESITGKGVTATIDGTTYYAGKPGMFAELGVDFTGDSTATDGGVATTAAGLHDERVAELQGEGKTVVLVGSETEVVGAIAIADEVRPGAVQTVTRLKELGVDRLVVLTGDNEGTARAIAERVGIEEYRAELLPEEKVDAIEELLADCEHVAMVGDGVNDAPALATATVGVAMGAAGTDTAIETADVALMGDDLSKLPYLYALSREANGVIRQNIWASLGVKALLAVGVPLGYVSVALAVVAGDMGMSLGVTGNAMRLSRIRPDSFTDEDE